jgi:preprotein translocase subunit SecF
MGAAVYSSIFFATPVLVFLKEREPRVAAHKARVLARRANLVEKDPVGAGRQPSMAGVGASTMMAGTSAPRPGQRPSSRPAKSRKR